MFISTLITITDFISTCYYNYFMLSYEVYSGMDWGVPPQYLLRLCSSSILFPLIFIY